MHRVSAPIIPSGPCSPVMTLPLIDTVSRFMSFHSCASSDLPRPRVDVWESHVAVAKPKMISRQGRVVNVDPLVLQGLRFIFVSFLLFGGRSRTRVPQTSFATSPSRFKCSWACSLLSIVALRLLRVKPRTQVTYLPDESLHRNCPRIVLLCGAQTMSFFNQTLCNCRNAAHVPPGETPAFVSRNAHTISLFRSLIRTWYTRSDPGSCCLTHLTGTPIPIELKLSCWVPCRASGLVPIAAINPLRAER